MWPFKDKISALRVIREIVDAEQNEKLISELGIEAEKIQLILLQHALLLLAVKFLPVSNLWESAICNSFALSCAEYDPENKSRLGVVLYQYPFDESPFDKASFYGQNMCRPIVKSVEFFYALNSLTPNRFQVLTHAILCGGKLIASAKLITSVEKSLKVVP